MKLGRITVTPIIIIGAPGTNACKVSYTTNHGTQCVSGVYYATWSEVDRLAADTAADLRRMACSKVMMKDRRKSPTADWEEME